MNSSFFSLPILTIRHTSNHYSSLSTIVSHYLSYIQTGFLRKAWYTLVSKAVSFPNRSLKRIKLSLLSYLTSRIFLSLQPALCHSRISPDLLNADANPLLQVGWLVAWRLVVYWVVIEAEEIYCIHHMSAVFTKPLKPCAAGAALTLAAITLGNATATVFVNCANSNRVLYSFCVSLLVWIPEQVGKGCKSLCRRP